MTKDNWQKIIDKRELTKENWKYENGHYIVNQNMHIFTQKLVWIKYYADLMVEFTDSWLEGEG